MYIINILYIYIYLYKRWIDDDSIYSCCNNITVYHKNHFEILAPVPWLPPDPCSDTRDEPQCTVGKGWDRGNDP